MTSSSRSVCSNPIDISDRPWTTTKVIRHGRQFLVWLGSSVLLMGCGVFYGWGMTFLADAIAQAQFQSFEPHLAQAAE